MEARVDEALAKLSLEEKAALVSGADFWHTKAVDRLGIPSVMVADGPHGLRKQDGQVDHVGLADSVPATCFPTASAVASSWDPALQREIGVALAEECLAEGVSVILGPGVNMKRSPLCGRNFEYFSEDPHLSGEMGAAFVEGVQSLGVGTSLKHFAANNQEHRRMSIDAVVDERNLREYYLPAFETVVKRAKPWTVMCSYNRLNGTYASENGWLLDRVLRQEWGFEGLLVTDWGACNDRVAGLAAGQDLEMPSSGAENAATIVEAVRSGALSQAVLDASVRRVLDLAFRGEANRRPGYPRKHAEHHELARRAATESMVLLRNEGGILPLAPGASIALVGEFAEKPRFQGSGSSLINPARLDSIRGAMGDYSSDVTWARGYDSESDSPDARLIAEAVAAARSRDIVILVAGLTASYEVEGADRRHLRLPASHLALIEALAAANPNLVVVLANGSAVEMPWLGRSRAVLEAFLAGEAGALAVLDLLFGRATPSGKLSETFPAALDDLPSSRHFPEGPASVEYREGPFVGYRWYDAAAEAASRTGEAAVEPLFPFGFGLSYTTFAYSGFALSTVAMRDTDTLRLRCRVRNTGPVAGAEVVQVYVRDVESTVLRPFKELKAFARLELGPGEEKEALFELDRRAFAYWDCGLGDWNVESGSFEVMVGASSRDIRGRATVHVDSSRPDHRPKDLRALLPSYSNPPPRAAAFRPSDAEFAALLGRNPPPKAKPRGAAFDMSSTIADVRITILGRLLFRLVLWVAQATAAGGDAASRSMVKEMVLDMPLRNITALSGGKPSFRTVRFLLGLMNLGRRRA
jgi:beta-glucosidase